MLEKKEVSGIVKWLIVILVGVALLMPVFAEPVLTKEMSLIHGVSEQGNLQVYYVINILEDGKIIDSQQSIAYTTSDVNDMEGFDQRSKDIVSAIIDQKVKDDFEAEKKVKTGIGIEKIISWDRTIKKDGCISIRRVTRIFNEGKEISKRYHRSWINPGDTPTGDVMSKAVAKKIHTKEVKDAYNER